MAHERLRNSGLAQALTDLLADLADLLRKELQLAKTEITEKIVSRLRASVWMVVAGVLGMVAALLLVEASCLLVAAVLAAAAAAAFFQGRAAAQDELLPTRTAKQISQDIKTAKEQLT
jgi:hypothetical protein